MANARKILIVDDDTDLRDTLVEQLSLHDEFEASAVDTGAKGASAAKTYSPDLVLMDVGLPDTDGREVVRSLRKSGFKAPIIILTGHDTDSDTILGLESGANDYVAKPFRFAVLLARIRAQLRQHEASEDAVFSVGPYSFRPGSKMLTGANARKVRLTEKETAILRFLYRAGQLPVSRETLLQEVWGYNSGVTTHTLETHIYRLRQKIESPKPVATSWCRDRIGHGKSPLPACHRGSLCRSKTMWHCLRVSRRCGCWEARRCGCWQSARSSAASAVVSSCSSRATKPIADTSFRVARSGSMMASVRRPSRS